MGEDTKALPIELGGMWKPGDLAGLPPGKTPLAKNIVTRPGQEAYIRERYRHAGPDSVDVGVPSYYPQGFLADWPRLGRSGIAFFETNTDTNRSRNVWIFTSSIQQPEGIYRALTEPILTDYFWLKHEFQGSQLLAVDAHLYLNVMCFSAIRPTLGNPSAIGGVKLVGTNVEVVDNILEGGIQVAGAVLGVFGRRLVIGNVQRTVTNLVGSTDPDAMFGIAPPWESLNAVAQVIEGVTVLTPDLATGVVIHEISGVANIDQTTATDYFVISELYNSDPVDDMPITVSAYISGPLPQRSTYYGILGTVLVEVATDSERYLWKLLQAGTTDAVAPTYTPTKDSDVIDGTTIWRNIGPDTLVSEEVLVPPASDAREQWTVVGLAASFVPISGTSNGLGMRIRFGITDSTTWPLAPLRIGQKDGLPVGDPLKKNHGQQITVGTISAPFVQNDTANSSVVPDTANVFWWTEIDSFEVTSLNFQRLTEQPGGITAIAIVAGRMIIYKRGMAAIYQLGSDVNLPFVRERVMLEYGCSNQRAWDVMDDVVYTVSQFEVYSFDGSGAPQPLAGDAMRYEMFKEGDDLLPPSLHRLGVDREKREVHVVTQKSKIYVLNLETSQWSERTIQGVGDVPSETISDLAWAFDSLVTVGDKNGIVVRDKFTVTGPDEDSVGGAHPVPLEYWFPQITGPEVVTALIEKLHFSYRSSLICNFFVDVSEDGGETWLQIIDATTPPTNGEMSDFVQIPVWHSGAEVWVRIRYYGDAGRDAFRMVGLSAYVQMLGETIPDFNAEFK